MGDVVEEYPMVEGILHNSSASPCLDVFPPEQSPQHPSPYFFTLYQVFNHCGTNTAVLVRVEPFVEDSGRNNFPFRL